MPIILQITVTQEILDDSQTCQYTPSHCAVARAVRTIFPHANVFPLGGIFIDDESANNYCKNKSSTGIKLPLEAIEFIEKFDGGITVEPFSFEIDIPDSIVEKINIDEIRPLLDNHPTLKILDHGYIKQ